MENMKELYVFGRELYPVHRLSLCVTVIPLKGLGHWPPYRIACTTPLAYSYLDEKESKKEM